MNKRVPIKHLFDISRSMVMPTDFGGAPLFHYSLPAWHEHGDGVIENASDLASGKLLLKGNELLVSKLNPEKGAVILAKAHNNTTVCSPEFIAMVPRAINRQFAYYLMLSAPLRRQLCASVESVTNSHKRARVDRFMASSAIVPDFPTQKRIAAFLDRETERIDKLIAKKERLVEVQKSRLHALLQTLVLGGATVSRGYEGVNRPGFPRGISVQNLRCVFKSIHLCMELILHFLRRPVADGAV